MDAKNFYPRPPRGGRHISLVYPQKTALFLSTPSARRATLLTPRGADVDRYFYPRPPRGGRQLSTSDMAQGRRFLSTPSARRATLSSLNTGTGGADFYPRPPRGGRRDADLRLKRWAQFLSTPSARRATNGNPRFFHVFGISIHALREEGDAVRRSMSAFTLYFYPRPPRGGRP